MSLCGPINQCEKSYFILFKQVLLLCSGQRKKTTYGHLSEGPSAVGALLSLGSNLIF